MRIAYLYDLPSKSADAWGCERVFVDLPAMRRASRSDLIERGGLRSGDVLVVCKLSQLGHGRESTVVQDRVKAIGATVEVVPLPKPDPTPRRTGWLSPTDDQKRAICPLWRSTEPAAYVIQRASDVMNAQVDRNWLNRHCGKRSKN